uniref:Anaphase-promoting complex subunit 4 n=1 Tax=Lygus hesperus TaxID=30085 RepID=A0A146L2N3_LYGHE
MAANTYAMRQMEERHMATKVDLMVWSQKMDLLAITNAKGEVSLHRLSWQKVWSLSPPGDGILATGIAWRSDGKVIAISYSNNELFLVNVENKDIIDKRTYSSPTSEDSPLIYFLCWLEERGGPKRSNNEASQNGADNYLPKLPPISRTFGSITEENNEVYEDMKKIDDQHELNLLVVGLADGRFDLSVFGLFGVGLLSIPEPKTDRILAVDVAPDLARLFVLVTSENGEIKLLAYSTSIIAKYCSEIHALGCKYGHIMSLLDYLENTMQAITEACENMLLSEMESKLSQYADSMPKGSVSADFLELLMFGVASDTLEAFLLQELTDKGIKKLSHSMELSHSNIQKLILKHLQPVGQKIAFHLSDLRGMSRLMERFQVVGIEEEAVSRSFRENGSFLVKASEVIGVTDMSLKKYKALFKWLYDVIMRLIEEGLSLPGVSEQDTAFIADYLYSLEGNAEEESDPNTPSSDPKPVSQKKRCYLDLLGQYIIDSELSDPVPSEANPWEKFLSDNPCIADHPSVIPRYTNLSLVQQHKRLKTAISNVFDRPKAMIGQKICLEEVIKLMSVTVPNPKASMRFADSTNHLVIAFIPQPNSTYFTHISVDVNQAAAATNKMNVYFKGMDCNVGYTTVDLQLFNDSALSVLLSEPADGAAVFAQIQLKRIDEASRSAAIASQMRLIDQDGDKYIDGCLLPDCRMKSLDNMRASRLAVSGGRKVAVILSENTHKVRTYELEVEEDEEEEELETTRSSTDT